MYSPPRLASLDNAHNSPPPFAQSNNRARLPALYSDFQSQRTLNPDGYQANISAWRKALARIAKSGLAPSPTKGSNSQLVLNTNEQLLRALEAKQYGRPLALGAVVREALAHKDLMPVKDFLAAKESIYAGKGWSVSGAVWGIASWGARQLGVADILKGSSDKLPAGQFVVVANVEEAGNKFTSQQKTDEESRFARTFSRAHFYKTFNEQLSLEGAAVGAKQQLSDQDMEILLKHLSRDKGVLLYDGSTVKIKSPTDTSATEPTEEDASIAQLKELIASLTHQTTLLNERVDELSQAAKEAVSKKNRVAALAALKSKKLAEATLEKRFASLSQLEEVAAKIEQASDNVQLVRVMESSAGALESLHAQVGGVERVEEVVDKLREQMTSADEVNSILADSATVAGVVVDEGEIDDELAAMENEEKNKVEEAQRAKEEAEKAARAKDLEREAEEMRKRLEAIEKVPEKVASEEENKKQTEEAEAMMSRMSLKD